MNGIFAQRRARLLSMKAVREAGPQASACPGCGAQSDRTVLSRNLWVCPKCGHHFPLDAYSRLKSVLDAGSFRELNEKYPAADPLRFPGYPEKLKKAQEKTGLTEAVVTALGTIGGRRCVVGVMDSRFFMGSMSAAVGPGCRRGFSLLCKWQRPAPPWGGTPKRDYCIYLCSQIPLPAA